MQMNIPPIITPEEQDKIFMDLTKTYWNNWWQPKEPNLCPDCGKPNDRAFEVEEFLKISIWRCKHCIFRITCNKISGSHTYQGKNINSASIYYANFTIYSGPWNACIYISDLTKSYRVIDCYQMGADINFTRVPPQLIEKVGGSWQNLKEFWASDKFHKYMLISNETQ